MTKQIERKVESIQSEQAQFKEEIIRYHLRSDYYNVRSFWRNQNYTHFASKASHRADKADVSIACVNPILQVQTAGG